MKPLRDLLLISLEKKEDKTESGIFVSKGWNTAQNIAVVDATGPFVESAEPGQRILINPYACIDIPGNETQKFIREKDVMSHV